MRMFSSDQISEAVELLRKGGVLIFPTETSYGVGCDATNVEAVERVFAVKERPRQKGVPILLPTIESVDAYLVVTDHMQALIHAHWPGPLNIVGEIAQGSPVAQLCAQDGTQTARVSSHPVAAALARQLGRPIVATSANRSGQPAWYAIPEEISLSVDGVVDVGELPIQPASTIVRVTADGQTILRQGSISL